MGYQIKGQYESALRTLGEEKVIKNMLQVIASLKSGERLSNEDKQITTATGLLSLFKRKPGLVQAFRNKLMHEPESIGVIFSQRTDYTKMRVEAINNEAERARENVALAEQYIDKLEIEAPEEYAKLVSQLKSKYEEASATLKPDINNQIAEIEKDMKIHPNDEIKQTIGKQMLEDLRNILAALGTENITPSEWKEMTKSWIVPGAALGFASLDRAEKTDVLAL
jgi:F0F1-type ATP synthase membrane subunit b/b'